MIKKFSDVLRRPLVTVPLVLAGLAGIGVLAFMVVTNGDGSPTGEADTISDIVPAQFESGGGEAVVVPVDEPEEPTGGIGGAISDDPEELKAIVDALPVYPGAIQDRPTFSDGIVSGSRFSTQDTRDIVFGFYDEELRKDGWDPFSDAESLEETVPPKDGFQARGTRAEYEKDGTVLVLTVSQNTTPTPPVTAIDLGIVPKDYRLNPEQYIEDNFSQP